MKAKLFFLFGAVCALMLTLASCTELATEPPIPMPTPTTHSLFIKADTYQPIPANIEQNDPVEDEKPVIPNPTTLASPTVKPSITPAATATPRIVQREIILYDEEVKENWGLSTKGMTYLVNSPDFAFSGNGAIAFTPSKPEGMLYFALQSNTDEVYRREDVIGFSFHLHSGRNGLELDDMAFSAIGSNEVTYFIEGDNSAVEKTAYQNTYLRWLGFNEAIPRNTWIEVDIILNKMQFDPIYEYVTGFYITNRIFDGSTYYLDDISIIVQEVEDQQ